MSKNITVQMDIEDDIGNKFRANVTISLEELRVALAPHNLDIYDKEN